MPITIDPNLLGDLWPIYYVLNGTAGNDTLYGTAARDKYDGKDGNDFSMGTTAPTG
jgi:Ca2+-binding RTX toxin-like protein